MASANVSELRYLQGFRVAGATRKAMWQGREHYVVPVVALMEGVIHAVNANNAEFVPFRTFAQNVNQWNGRPLMLGHPVRDGIHIAANEPTVLESACFGAVFNTRIEKKRLMMDAYVDPDRLKALGRHELLTRVIEGQPIEISIGAAVATDNNEGEWNGKPYKGNWLALSADHLAFLENGRGACSLEMGCGAHRAAQENLVVTNDEDSFASRIAAAVVKILGGKGSGNFGHAGRPGHVGGSVPDGEGGPSFKEGSSVVIGNDFWVEKHRGRKGVIKSISESADGKPTAWVKYADHDGGSFVLLDSLKPANSEKPATASSADIPSLYANRKHGDVLAKSARGTVEKNGDPKRPFAARAKSGEILGTYSTVENAKAAIHNQAAIKNPDNFPSGWRNPKPAPKWRDLEERDLASAYKDCPMCQGSGETNGNPCEGCEGTGELKVAEHHGDTDMTRQGYIDKITGCACSGFTKADIKGLEGLTDEGLKALAGFVETKEKGAADDEEKEKEKDAEKRSLEAKITTLETELRAASTKKLTLDEFKARAPEEVLTLLAEKEARDLAEINGLVTTLKAASEGVYTETELRAMSATQLRNLAKIAKVTPPDFSGQGMPALRAASSTEDFTPPNPYDAVLKAK